MYYRVAICYTYQDIMNTVPRLYAMTFVIPEFGTLTNDNATAAVLAFNKAWAVAYPTDFMLSMWYQRGIFEIVADTYTKLQIADRMMRSCVKWAGKLQEAEEQARGELD